MRTIRVTGKGQLKVHPDTTRITMTLSWTYPEYAETLCRSSEDTEKLKDLLVPFGFERTDLKTLSFDVDTVYESYKEKEVYKQRLIGYKYEHVMKVEFESDNERLGRILYALSDCSLQPEFRLSYTVKDPEATKNELLGKAVQDAMAKANVLSTAAGLHLGDIQSVDYSWGHIEFEFNPMRDDLACGGGMDLCEKSLALPMDIEPDDIDVGDTVTVVWEIG